MKTFLSYFVAVNLLLVLQVVYYRVFLSRQRKFQWNRIFLLSGMGIAMFLPLLRFEVVPPSLPDPSFIRTLPMVVIGSGPAVEAAVSAPSPSPAWTAWEWWLLLYGIGVGLALTVLLVRNLFIFKLIWQGQKTRQDGYTLVVTQTDVGPASWFRYVFWNGGQGLDGENRAVALAHERCHSRQLHSLDLLAVELFKAFCWMNPAVYYLRRYLRQTHEFLADQAALEVAGLEGIKRLMLLRTLGSQPIVLGNHFHSYIKSRIVMLTQNRPSKPLLRYLFILPLAGLMVACTSVSHPAGVEPTIPVMSVALVDSPSTSDSFRTAASSEFVPPATPFIDLHELFVEAGMPAPNHDRSKEGLTCLGHQPPVFYVDSVYPKLMGTSALATTDATHYGEKDVADAYPELLNRDYVAKRIGYPKEARAQKIEGKVIVKILVDETGHVARYQFLEERHPLLRDAVEAHVEEFLFKPGKKEGKATQWWVVLPIWIGPGC
jgi:TonB family protein